MTLEGVPSRRELIAVYWAGRVLKPEGLTRQDAHDSYRTLPLAGRLDLADLLYAEELLISHRLVARDDERLIPDQRLCGLCQLDESIALELLLAAILEQSAPLWLRTAAAGHELRDELIPEVAETLLASIIEDPAQREAFLLARGRKVEAEQRAAIGALGEEAVVAAAKAQLIQLGRHDLADQVAQVSLISDELGYDVTAPRLTGSTRRLEVKTAGAAGSSVTIFLSRTEASVGLADANWSLVVCELQADADASVVGWVSATSIQDQLPVNQHPEGRWESARLRLLVSSLNDGLPPAS
jgi:hypothetical protein